MIWNICFNETDENYDVFKRFVFFCQQNNSFIFGFKLLIEHFFTKIHKIIFINV